MTRAATGTLSSAAVGADRLTITMLAVAMKEARTCKFPSLRSRRTGGGLTIWLTGKYVDPRLSHAWEVQTNRSSGQRSIWSTRLQ